MRNPELTDIQVLTLIRSYPGTNIYQINKIAKIEMPRWSWSVGKIHKAVQRLKKGNKIEGRIKISGGRACQELYCKL
jgi:hypothetical protein